MKIGMMQSIMLDFSRFQSRYQKQQDKASSGLFQANKTKRGQMDAKARSILAKANGGKKITKAELKYIAVHCPESYPRVKRAVDERERFEQKMKRAKTKQEVTNTFMNSVCCVKQGSQVGFDMSIRYNQMTDAYHKYTNTKEYHQKKKEK